MNQTSHSHFKIYKPFGMLSQFQSNDPKEINKKRFLGELFDFPNGTMPVGRLDEKSEGLLLLTTDGKLSDAINRSGIEKEYYAQLDGEISKEALNFLESGVEIGVHGKKYLTKQCKARLLKTEPNFTEPSAKLRIGRHRPTSWIRVVLTEGRFRQVRKMTAAVGFPTLRLVRVRIDAIDINTMVPGSVKPLPFLLKT